MKAYQLTLPLFTPGIELRSGDRVLILKGKHNGETGIVSFPAGHYLSKSIIAFRGRNNLGSYTRDQVFVIKRKKW